MVRFSTGVMLLLGTDAKYRNQREQMHRRFRKDTSIRGRFIIRSLMTNPNVLCSLSLTSNAHRVCSNPPSTLVPDQHCEGRSTPKTLTMKLTVIILALVAMCASAFVSPTGKYSLLACIGGGLVPRVLASASACLFMRGMSHRVEVIALHSWMIKCAQFRGAVPPRSLNTSSAL